MNSILSLSLTTALLCLIVNCGVTSGTTCGQVECGSGHECCNDINTGSRCYNPQTHMCASNPEGQFVLCGTNEGACNNYCFDRSLYCCQDGMLMQREFCRDDTTGSTSGSTGGSTMCGSNECSGPSNACCNDMNSGSTCYDPEVHECTLNQNGQNILCPRGLSSCNNACYDPSQYCCEGAGLQHIQHCEGAGSSTTGGFPTTGGDTSTTTTTGGMGFQCNAAASVPGPICPSAATCCGQGTMSPSCLVEGDDSKKCCRHYLSATQCNSTQGCCGGGGPGASSYAFCCPEGKTCCNAGTGQGTCCGADEICCARSSVLGFCCPSGSTCNLNSYSCDTPATQQ